MANYEKQFSIVTWDCSFRENLQLFQSVANQRYSDFDFIWVDYYQGSKPARELAAKHEAQFLPLNHPASEAWHLGVCFNRGVEQTSNEWLILSDGDIWLPPEFLAGLNQRLSSCKDVVYFYRADEVRQGENGSEFRIIHTENYATCVCVHRTLFNQVGGYDEHLCFSKGGLSGRDFYYRLKHAGANITWDPEAILFHPWHPSTGSLAKQLQIGAMNLARLRHQWIDAYGGLEQSWVIHRRKTERLRKTTAPTTEALLQTMPKINLTYWRLAARLSSILKRRRRPAQFGGELVPAPAAMLKDIAES